jgi:hypothetical protein
MSLLKSTITIKPVIAAFEQLGINYYIGGSVASSAYGIPRTTIDVDIIADLRLEHVRPLVKLLEATYYVDADMIREAIRSRSEFNVIHLGTMLKVDVFIPKTRSFDQSMLHRIRQEKIDPSEDDRLFYLASPEDTILTKLEWYRMGGEVSERQWNDLLGVLKLQGTSLDFAYLRRWATDLNVADLLERAYEDAGLNEPEGE